MRKEIDVLTKAGLIAGLAFTQACSGVSGKDNRSTRTQTPEATQNFTATPTETAVPTAKPTEAPKPLDFYGIDFGSKNPISFDFFVPKLNNKNTLKEIPFSTTPITYSDSDPCSQFIPDTGTSCEYADGSSADNDIIHFVHSGIGYAFNPLEGEGLRRYFEDFDPKNMWAQNTITNIQQNMDLLIGQKVKISQENVEVDATVKNVYRISPDQLAGFDDLTNLIPQLEKDYPGAAVYANDNQKEIYVIFCGWLVPGEDHPKGLDLQFFTWSRYVIVLQAANQ